MALSRPIILPTSLKVMKLLKSIAALTYWDRIATLCSDTLASRLAYTSISFREQLKLISQLRSKSYPQGLITSSIHCCSPPRVSQILEHKRTLQTQAHQEPELQPSSQKLFIAVHPVCPLAISSSVGLNLQDQKTDQYVVNSVQGALLGDQISSDTTEADTNRQMWFSVVSRPVRDLKRGSKERIIWKVIIDGCTFLTQREIQADSICVRWEIRSVTGHRGRR